MLRKYVYPYDYMDELEKFNEKFLPEKNDFYSNVNMEDVTDSNCMHAKTVCKGSEIKYLGEYHELHLTSNTLLLGDVFENIRKTRDILHDKTEYFIHIGNLRQDLNHGLVLKKIQRVIKFNQKDWLKSYTDMNSELRKKKSNFEKDFFRLLNS